MCENHSPPPNTFITFSLGSATSLQTHGYQPWLSLSSGCRLLQSPPGCLSGHPLAPFPSPRPGQAEILLRKPGLGYQETESCSLAEHLLAFPFYLFSHVFFPLISRFLPPSLLSPFSHCPLNHLLALLFPVSYLPSPCLGPGFVYTIPGIWIHGTNMLSHTQMFPNIWVVWHFTATAAG